MFEYVRQICSKYDTNKLEYLCQISSKMFETPNLKPQLIMVQLLYQTCLKIIAEYIRK